MLQIREQQQYRTRVLALTGQITHDTTMAIQARIIETKGIGWQHVILDFSGITEIDSKGIGELLYWYHNLKPYYVEISIANPQTPIWNQLDMGHVSESIPIYGSQEEAMWNNIP